jgi:dipeptidyl aminopeptidase/acylaminoacyl peptidase
VKPTATYGTWKSPITAALIAESTVRLGEVHIDGDVTYVVETRPREMGRSVLVRIDRGGPIDAVPPGFSVRTRAHEYGGGAVLVVDGVIYFANDDDQRVYRMAQGGEPMPITPPVPDRGDRYADFALDRPRQRLVAVREDHTAGGHEPESTLVAIDLAAREGALSVHVLVRGADFYSSPRLSPDGRRLAWLCWRHPNMPWDGTELWVAELDAQGVPSNAELVAGGENESIFQPTWSPAGELHFVSDRTGWWNLYRRSEHGAIEPLYPREAEFGAPQWGFGMATYGFAADGRIVCAFTAVGEWHLAALDPRTGHLAPYGLPYTTFSMAAGVRVGPERCVFVAGSPVAAEAVIQLNPRDGDIDVLHRSAKWEIEPATISIPEPIEFPTEGGQTAYAFYYPPHNAHFQAPEGTRPPLIVMSHGGPTSAVGSTLELRIQYWTSRGFAVANVNYGGSTGYGRDYRNRLWGQWGVVDVDDCVNAARALVKRGAANPEQLAITGGSAGGYTTLCALAFRNDFSVGASYYGVSDLEGLARDTHKFEARYLDRLVGPYPAKRELYQERSPIHAADQIDCPVIFFQGLEDAVVLPNQAEIMVEALRRNGVPVAYLPFAGEQHGFRRAETIVETLEAELYFYGRVFGFDPAGQLPPIPIANEAALPAAPAPRAS